MEHVTLTKKVKIKGLNFSMRDLLLTLPIRYEKKLYLENFNDLQPDTLYKFVFHKISIKKNKGKLIMQGKVLNKEITVFHSAKLLKYLYNQETLLLCGKFDRDTVFFPDLLKNITNKTEIHPVYKNLTTFNLKNLIEIIPQLPTPCNTLFKAIHFPVNELEIQLALEQLLQIELSIFLTVISKFQKPRPPLIIYDVKSPFILSEDQENTFQEIKQDLMKDHRFVRIVHGEVGSGKTLLAYLTSMIVAQNGKKVAIMAPTGILANQIYEFFKNNNYLNLNIGLIISETVKKSDLESLKQYDIFIGTHALLYKTYFEDLGLLIIDEQHRFGVNQRNNLIKENSADVLMLTATPIPRTFQMMMKGYIEFSVLSSRPSTGKRITAIASSTRLDEIFTRMIDISLKNKVIWICKTISLADERYVMFLQENQNTFLVHGKMKEKNQILKDFDSKAFGILVATTVIEVGIDIDVNFIFIEEADMFGTSQLHQLRGRVARRESDGFCILIGKNLSKLRSIKNADDGFLISELDAEKRGAGMIHGTQQSGFSSFRFAKTLQNLKIVQCEITQKDIELARKINITEEIAELVGDFYEANI
jgi:RecG-like helicase